VASRPPFNFQIPETLPGDPGPNEPTGFQFNPAINRTLDRQEQALLGAAQSGNPAAIVGTAAVGAGSLFGRGVGRSLGAEDPREIQARLVQDAALEIGGLDATPGSPEYTQALTNAFASRGLASEALAAQAQGKQFERQQAQIDTATLRQQKLQAETIAALRAQNEAVLGTARLTRAELLKDDKGRAAWALAGREVLRQNQERISAGQDSIAGQNRVKLQEELATAALAQLAQSGSTTTSTGDTGTTTSRTQRDQVSFGGVTPAAPAVQAVRAEGQQQPLQISITESANTASAQLLDREPVVKPTTAVNASKSGPTTIKPSTRAPAGGGAKAKRERVKAARERQTSINSGVRALNRYVEVLSRVGPKLDLGRFSLPGVGEVSLTSLATSAAALNPFASEENQQGTRRFVKELRELRSAYENLITGMTIAASGKAASEGEREATKQRILDPTSVDAKRIGLRGVLDLTVDNYRTILDEAQRVSDETSEPIKVDNFHPAIRVRLAN